MVTCEKNYKLPDVFVISSGRSGTTLLASILNASNQIHFPYESDFVARAYPFYHKKNIFNEEDYQIISRLFKLSSQPEGWGMSEEYLCDFLKQRNPQTFAEVGGVICEAFHHYKGTGDLLWGIKAPVLIASVQKIQAVYPKAKIVHLVRDGRDVYLSYKKVHETSLVKFGPKSVIENALYWVDGLRRMEEFVNHNQHKKIYELKYENFINHPSSELAKLCDYLDIKYEPSMHDNFNNHERNQKFTPEKLQQSIHKNLQTGLVTTNTQKYLTQMSKLEKIQYELVASPYLRKYGYQLEYPMLAWLLFLPLRGLLYFLARTLNNCRYSWRDRRMYINALQKG